MMYLIKYENTWKIKMVELEKQDLKKNKELYKKIENKLRKEININIPIDHVVQQLYQICMVKI